MAGSETKFGDVLQQNPWILQGLGGFAYINKLYGFWMMGIVFQEHMGIKRRDESRM